MAYKENNLKNPRTLFSNRIDYYYNALSYKDKYDNLIDFNFSEKLLYGRVERNFAPMTVVDSNGNLKSFSSVNGTQNQRAVNFVVDQFQEIKKQFDKCSLTGKINPNQKFLSNLKVYKAYVSPADLYIKHYKQIMQAFSSPMKGKVIYDADSFLSIITPYLLKVSKTIPITKQAFLKSKMCPIHVSGLAVEISNLTAVNDQMKVQEFYNNPNFEFYLNTCRSFGFMIDQDMPWRMVADLASTEMISSASKYNLFSTDQIINSIYNTNTIQNYRSFVSMIREVFLSLVDTHSEIRECPNGNIRHVILRDDRDLSKLSEETLLDLYLNIRLSEEERGLTENQKRDTFSETRIRAQTNLVSALSLFELFMSETYNYSGSLTKRSAS